MTRIIAGLAGSLVLRVPATGTRPTSDRVREAVFSALEARRALQGARVLDLYAGSGALGLEAVSRGAASAVLVERSAAAARACRANAAAVLRAAPAARVEVAQQSVARFLGAGLHGAGSHGAAAAEWDLVFLDPPYDLPAAELAAALGALAPRLAPGATVVVERRSRSGEPPWPAGIAPERDRRYGDTTLWWARAG
ncbi:MAG: RsmD family RNA methyltransferase [Microbacteriaceae bacterium]